MKNRTDEKLPAPSHCGAQSATAQSWLLVSVFFILVAGGSWFYWRQAKQPVVEVAEPAVPGVVLSDSTTKILAGLETPVAVRWFVPADFSVLPSALSGYLARVELLLVEYERVAAGKLHVTKSDPQTDAAAKVAAGAAGVVPFATENGEIVYLGLTIGSGTRVEAVAPLAPEWEAALESDVSRAIARVTAKLAQSGQLASTSQTPAQPVPIDPAISEELLRAFPNLAVRSFDDAAKTLRERTLEEFKIAAAEMQTKLAEAQKELAEAQSNKSEADVLAAQKNLQRVQADQASKLNGITANLQERIVVLQQLKSASKLPAVAQ